MTNVDHIVARKKVTSFCCNQKQNTITSTKCSQNTNVYNVFEARQPFRVRGAQGVRARGEHEQFCEI